MAEGTNYSNTVRAGAFLITGLLLGLVVIVTLQKTSIFASKSRYLVHFGMDEAWRDWTSDPRCASVA